MSVYKSFQEKVVDGQVSKKSAALDEEFNERVRAQVEKVMSAYRNAEASTRLEAERLAQEARNQVLNLQCPHCGVAYFGFTGCMALQCQVCEGNFCGYCHQPCATGMGAHEHVRQCLMNETDNGSYYAKPDSIREAQKRYRTRKLKTFLRKHKKNIQNAIIIELKDDLASLDIKQEALFELGNLMAAEDMG